MPVPLVAAASAAPALVRGVGSGVSAVGGALGIGTKRTASGAAQRVVDDERARVNAMTRAVELQAVLTTRGNTPWGYAWTTEAQALAQTRLDQMLAANRAASGGGAPSSLFSGGPGAASGGDSYTVAGSNAASQGAATVGAGMSLPLILGGVALVGVLVYFFAFKR